MANKQRQKQCGQQAQFFGRPNCYHRPNLYHLPRKSWKPQNRPSLYLLVTFIYLRSSSQKFLDLTFFFSSVKKNGKKSHKLSFRSQMDEFATALGIKGMIECVMVFTCS